MSLYRLHFADYLEHGWDEDAAHEMAQIDVTRARRLA